MFSIRKIKDSIITKSVTPSTGRQLAKVLLENAKLQAELDQAKSELVAKDFNPEQGITAEPPKPITSNVVPKPAKPIDPKPVDVMTGIERERIEAVSQLIKELDAKAIESQKAYSYNNGRMTVSAHAVILPTGAPNARLQASIGEENTRRIANQQEPFLTYSQWYEADKVEAPAADARFVTTSNTLQVNAKVSKAIASYMVENKYYILRDSGVTYIYNNCEAIEPSNKRVLRLMKQPVDGQPFNSSGNGNRVIYSDPVNPLENLTDKEHQSIVNDKPTFEKLMQVYLLASNEEGLEINFVAAQKIW